MDTEELGELFRATKEDRDQLVREIAQFVRTRETWPDAESLAMAIEDEFLAKGEL